MAISIVSSFISKEDVLVVNDYISTVKFHTKDDHVPLHDPLYEKYNAPFDLHTRGEMPRHILEIFSKYSKKFYEIVQSEEHEEYLPPMFSKHYIARYTSGKSVGAQFDSSKPSGTYKSILLWNDEYDGGDLTFPNLGYSIKPSPGDLVFFLENETNKCGIQEISNGDMFLSEAWVGKKGVAWFDNVDYDKVDWDNWEIKGF